MDASEAVSAVGGNYLSAGSPLLTFCFVVLNLFFLFWAVRFAVHVVKRVVVGSADDSLCSRKDFDPARVADYERKYNVKFRFRD